jgi:aldose 1-epimerase
MGRKEARVNRNRRLFVTAALVSAAAFGFLACKGKTASPPEQTAAPAPTQASGGMSMDIQKQPFDQLPDGIPVDIYTLTNKNGLKARIATYGGTIVSLEVPDKDGRLADIVLGHDSLAGYLDRKTDPYFGTIVGRYANRIAKATFTLDGITYHLAKNDGENTLHGGLKGFDAVVWQAEPVKEAGAVGLKLSYLSKDGEEGYPGNLSCTVVYTLTDQDELKISYEATTDKATPVNLTNHTYFNLAGQGVGDILGEDLMLNADTYLPTTLELLPTGEISQVKRTPFDFTSAKEIGADIGKVKGGYDNCYIIRGGGAGLTLAARVSDPATGRVLEISTTEPAIQFYTGNFLDGTITGKAGKVYKQHYGFCLETQHYPDSPNHPEFPSTILRPGEVYRSETIHKFLAE